MNLDANNLYGWAYQDIYPQVNLNGKLTTKWKCLMPLNFRCIKEK